MRIKRTVFRPNGRLNTRDSYEATMVQPDTRVALILPLLGQDWITAISLTRRDGFREEYTKEIA